MAEGLFHEAILDGPSAAHAPIGSGHFLDHAELDAVGGSETLGMLGYEVIKTRTRFVFQNHAPSQEGVANGVSGRAFLPLGGDRSSGAGRVGTGRVASSE